MEKWGGMGSVSLLFITTSLIDENSSTILFCKAHHFKSLLTSTFSISLVLTTLILAPLPPFFPQHLLPSSMLHNLPIHDIQWGFFPCQNVNDTGAGIFVFFIYQQDPGASNSAWNIVRLNKHYSSKMNLIFKTVCMGSFDFKKQNKSLTPKLYHKAKIP